jgi:hypothetical protein
MSDDLTKISRAQEVLNAHRVGEAASKILNHWFRYASTPTVLFEHGAKRDYLTDVETASVLGYQGQEIAVATGKFRSWIAPDGHTSSYADGFIYADGALVLKVEIAKNYDGFGSKIDFITRAHYIKEMKAGPWLKILAMCVDILEADAIARREANDAELARKKASKIDLGEF